jgi:hypothetical protein
LRKPSKKRAAPVGIEVKGFGGDTFSTLVLVDKELPERRQLRWCARYCRTQVGKPRCGIRWIEVNAMGKYKTENITALPDSSKETREGDPQGDMKKIREGLAKARVTRFGYSFRGRVLGPRGRFGRRFE